ncbi:hypothetical protein H0H93_012496 [Arthromyces matolae]|nr:hypothetical protein H0H93_012496 [Arthromyces matolae]
MKLDATDLRYISSDEFRVLTAVEMGSKNHEVVPTSLIAQISGLRNGGINKLIGLLAKRNLVSKLQNSKYDGYRLTYGGYDYLAMRALSKRDSMHSVGNQIGVGKESGEHILSYSDENSNLLPAQDIYIVANAEGKEMVLKLHRLGRISFRSIKEKRDYLGKRKSASWMYMSRLAAQKEWAFMKVLHEHGFPVPTPVDQARHTILMEFIDAYPLRQIDEVPSPGKLYSTLMDLIVRFARAGLIHGDFNEFNILIRRETGEPVVIDFPQMVSTSHENAEWKVMTENSGGDDFRLDVVVAASGFGHKDQKVLEEYMETVLQEEGSEEEEESEEEEGEDEEEGEKEEEEEELQLEEPLREEKPTTGTTNGPRHDTQRSSENLSRDELVSLSLPPPSTSRPVSPENLADLTSSLDISGIKNIVSNDLAKTRAAQQRKHHSKRGARRAGRPQGSKSKQDTRVKLDRSGMWD